MMEDVKTIYVPQTESTNRYLHDYQGQEGKVLTVVWTDFQTTGRGQGTNTWESERGKNLTFSLKMYPRNVLASLQYVMLEAAALAVRDVLAGLVEDITIKWPNDIYWRNQKLSGTLSECAVSKACVESCIVGIGINVNQRKFMSDAPNPVSLFQILGCVTDREALLDDVAQRVIYYLDEIDKGRYEDIHVAYKSHLYRSEGFHPFEDSRGLFTARIEDVKTNGHLLLRRVDGSVSEYAFKEVKFII